eukprot:g2686.t1
MSQNRKQPSSHSAADANSQALVPSRSGDELWSKASTATKPSVMFSSSFQTLRDMIVDAEIPTSKLTKIKRLGEGAFAVVDKCLYRTEDGFERQVAIKRLKPDVFKSQLDFEDFIREAMLLKKLSHFNVVDFLGVGSDVEKASKADTPIKKDSVYIVSEFMNRGTLSSQIIKQMKSIRQVYTLQDGLQWLIHIARGMKYLHNSSPRVIHRDLKIENIMLTEDYEGKIIAKIGDFGLHALVPKKRSTIHQPSTEEVLEKTSKKFLKQAKTYKRKKTFLLPDESVFNLSGKTGSLLYMAPEVLKSEEYNEKADVFSFSIVMYEVLQKCMLLAFISTRGIAAEIDQYIESVLAGFRPYIPQEWPKEVKNLLTRCWAGSIRDRPSMDEIVDELIKIQEMGVLHEKITSNDTPTTCGCCLQQ